MTYSPVIRTKNADSSADTPMPKGYLFNLLLFLIFVFPNWNLASFQLGPVITNIREVSLALLPTVYFFYPNRNKAVLRLTTKYLILAFFILLIGTELIKKEYYGISYFDTIKNIRIAVPVFSGLLVCLQGKKIDPEFCLKTISVTLIISCLITPILVLAQVGPAQFSMDGREFQVQYFTHGRILNRNYQFALIGLALLFFLPNIDTSKKGLKRLLIVASAFSLVIMVLFFNRTFLAATFLLGLLLFLKNLNLKTIGYIAGALVLVGAVGGYFYQTNEEIRDQIDDRILVVFQEEEGLAESVYYDNRDKLYAVYIDKLEDYWLLGLPGGEVLVDMGDDLMSSKSDISIFNIWIRYGLISVVIYVIIFIAIYLDQKRRLEYIPDNSLSYQIGYGVLMTIPFYVLVSLNVDVLVAHNAVLFLLLFITFFNVEDYKQLKTT